MTCSRQTMITSKLTLNISKFGLITVGIGEKLFTFLDEGLNFHLAVDPIFPRKVCTRNIAHSKLMNLCLGKLIFMLRRLKAVSCVLFVFFN